MSLPAGLYLSVQRFYAAHMQLLDAGAAEEWADTFTEDGEFVQDKDNGLPRRGRQAIADRMRNAVDRQSGTGVVSRHWIGMLALDPRPDGSVRTDYYALVVRTPRGGGADLHLSTVCQDLLVPDTDSWLVRRRSVSHDGRA